MFYDKLKKHCDEKGISLAKLAIEIGVPTKDTVEWERGVKPSPEVIEKIAAYFGESTDRLFPRLKILEPSFLHKLPDEYSQMHPAKLLEEANYRIEALCGCLYDNEQKAYELKEILSKMSVLCEELSDNHKEEFRVLIASAKEPIEVIIWSRS